MSIQMVFSIVSAVLVKLGLKACVQVKGYSRVLVTGGVGFIGSHIVDRLLSDGFDVTVFDDLSSGSLGNIAHHKGKEA